jgi:hypothetical protein
MLALPFEVALPSSLKMSMLLRQSLQRKSCIAPSPNPLAYNRNFLQPAYARLMSQGNNSYVLLIFLRLASLLYAVLSSRLSHTLCGHAATFELPEFMQAASDKMAIADALLVPCGCVAETMNDIVYL